MLAYPADLWLINRPHGANGYRTKMSTRNHSVSLAETKHYIIDPTNLCRALDDCVKDRLHVRRRAADDAEHLGGCGLMLQRLAQFRIALLDFFEQAHVFDGNHCLVSEGLEKADLTIGERTDLQSADHDSSNRGPLSQQRRSKYSAMSKAFLVSQCLPKLWIRDRR